MALQIVNAGDSDPDKIAGDLRGRIEAAIDGADVVAAGATKPLVGLFPDEVAGFRTVSFVYGAIAELMSGNSAPVHAIDRLECITP